MPKKLAKSRLLDSLSDTEERSGSTDSLQLEDTAEGCSSHIAPTMHPTVPTSFATLEPSHSVSVSEKKKNKSNGSRQLPIASIYNLRPRKQLVCATPAGPSMKRKRERSVQFKAPGADSGSSKMAPRSSVYNLRPRKQLVRSTPAGSSKRKRQKHVKPESPKASTVPVHPVIGPSDERTVDVSSPKSPSAALRPAIQISDLQFLKSIGEGAFGQVWFARLLTNNTACAVKVIRKMPFTDFESEVECMRRVDPSFPFIIQLSGHFSDWKHAFLVMEYLGFGDMMDHITRYGNLPESHVKLYIAEIACALQHLHDRQIVHGDLKPDNVMFGPDGHVKLIDFGVSAVVTRKGDDRFKKDWLKLGELMVEMLTGLLPEYEEDQELKLPQELSQECRNLIHQLLEKNSHSRLGGFVNLLDHPWFKGFHPEGVQLKLYEPRYTPSVGRVIRLSNFHPHFEHPDAKEFRLTDRFQSTFLTSFIPMPEVENNDASESTFEEQEE